MTGRSDRQFLRTTLRPYSPKRRQRLLASLAAASVAGTGSAAHADIATTLTGVPSSTTNAVVPVNHGSTSEALLSWSTAVLPEDENDWDQYADWNGRGDVYQINNRMTEIAFAPTSPTIKITIDSFEFDEWAGGTDTSSLWSV